MNTWKQTVAAAIQTPEAPVANPDASLAFDLETALALETVAPGSIDFAQSVLRGYAKYGSFTPKQADAVRNLLARSKGEAEPNPVEGPDASLAARLRAALPDMPGRDVDFATSLLSGFARYGSFTDRQRPHAERLAAYQRPELARNPFEGAPLAPQAPQQPASPALAVYPATAALFAPDRFSRFSVGPVSLSRSNDGALVWIKFAKYPKVVGKMSLPLGTTAIFPRIMANAADAATLTATLEAIERDPKAAAAADGIRTGRCSCCGRELTDPVSISAGIGPICAARF